jgi:GNAT superfamily N-acetyltransferase/DNA-binding MarR family transcriptional regulator
MPGARLTHEDRQQIATWLADGLGYAEIARRLGRPTSTISREVARNGESGGYLPDRAEQATARRARRRSPAQATRSATDGRPAEAVRDFVEMFATQLAATGFPRMAARVFVCLLTCDSGSLTAADLVRRLQVSPASVSKSVAYLEMMDLVVRRLDPGKRRERYVIVDDMWTRAWRTDTDAHARVANAAQRGAEILGADTPAGARLDGMGQFFAWLSGQMSDSGPAGAVGDRERDGYVLTRDPARIDVARVHRWLSEESYWAAGRAIEVVARSVEGSLPYSVFAGTDQVGFARAVTDGVTFAWICDVFVDDGHRGRGLGRWLVDSIVEDLSDDGVARFLLATKDAHEVYRRSGFAPLDGADRFMQIDRRPTRA